MIRSRRTGLELDAKLAGLDPRKVEQVVDQGQQKLAILANRGEVLLDFGRTALQIRMLT